MKMQDLTGKNVQIAKWTNSVTVLTDDGKSVNVPGTAYYDLSDKNKTSVRQKADKLSIEWHKLPLFYMFLSEDVWYYLHDENATEKSENQKTAIEQFGAVVINVANIQDWRP